MTSTHWKNSIAITGAGSGFGAALAHRYAADGWQVAVTDVDEARARQTLFEIRSRGGDGFARRLDVTRDDHWQRLHDLIGERWGGLEILINNAGIATSGNVEDTPVEDWEWVLDVDLMGVVRGCHQFAGMFKKQGAGHIVNVASFAGLAGLPFISAYSVAKAGVVALSEGLRAEMHGHGVGVTVVCPAFVKTRLLESFRNPDPGTREKVMHWMETSGITADQVATDIAKAVEDNTFLLLTHETTKKAWRLKRWLPERYFKMVAKRSPARRP